MKLILTEQDYEEQEDGEEEGEEKEEGEGDSPVSARSEPQSRISRYQLNPLPLYSVAGGAP